jgi:predicted nucleic acid-binding protein
MKPRVYIETTIPSYLTAWQSPQLVMAANQQVTREWWQDRRDEFDLFCSDLVVREAGAGDPDAAARRLAVIQEIPLLDGGAMADDLARALLSEVPLPAKAAADALHIAIAATHGIDYLLTWNCTHIANAEFRDRIVEVCLSFGLRCPTICTPQELLTR